MSKMTDNLTAWIKSYSSGKIWFNALKSIHTKRVYLQNFKVYRQILDENERVFDGRSKVTTPKGYQLVRMIIPRMAQLLFGSPKWFSVSGFEDSDRAKAEKVSTLLKWTSNRIDLKSKMKNVLEDNGIYGSCFIEVFWNKEIKTDDSPRQTNGISKQRFDISYLHPRRWEEIRDPFYERPVVSILG